MTLEFQHFGGTEVAQRYVDILSDAGFKAVFGNQRNQDVLIDTLNILLPPHRRVRSLTYNTTEIPGFTLSNKSVRLDLRCTGEDGTQFIVEMQCYDHSKFFRRCVEYSAKVYDSGSKRGKDEQYDIAPVYFIGILNHDELLEHDKRNAAVWREKFISEYTFREKDTMEVPDETIILIFVELNRFRKKLEDCHSVIDKWCHTMKNIRWMDCLPVELQTEVFERFFKACEIAKFSPEQKLEYERDMMTERDELNIIYTVSKKQRKLGLEQGLKRGLKQGLKQGREEGRTEERYAIAAKLKSMGMTVESIARATGMSEDEVREL